MNITREKAIRLFREHWRWLAETGSKYKERFVDGDVLNDCYLCDYCNALCSECPIEWPKVPRVNIRVDDSPCIQSYYSCWLFAENEAERKWFAKIISELPEKGGKNARID
jgi:hypothetical protein